jgi:hypothetical protein
MHVKVSNFFPVSYKVQATLRVTLSSTRTAGRAGHILLNTKTLNCCNEPKETQCYFTRDFTNRTVHCGASSIDFYNKIIKYIYSWSIQYTPQDQDQDQDQVRQPQPRFYQHQPSVVQHPPETRVQSTVASDRQRPRQRASDLTGRRCTCTRTRTRGSRLADRTRQPCQLLLLLQPAYM